MSYTITLVKGRLVKRLCGDFRAIKTFTVTDSNGKKEGVNGKVYQLIKKSTQVYYYNSEGEEVKLDTSASIEKFTGGNVKYVCDSYIETFDISDGESVHADAFANGAIVTYDEQGAYIPARNSKTKKYEEDDKFKVTKGKIIQTGTSVFIPNANLTKINKLPWCSIDSAAANGLDFIPIDPPSFKGCPSLNPKVNYWKAITDSSKSNMAVHTVEAEWGYYDENKTKVTQKFDGVVVGGRRHTISKRKRLQNKTRRQNKV